MDIELEYTVVDAFTHLRYAGNPAAVVLGADRLTEKEMAAIAAEFNLSETAYVLRPESGGSGSGGAAFRLRWFTPREEVGMCGHATLAAVHALRERGRYGTLAVDREAVLNIQTAAGILTVQAEHLPGVEEDVLFWLELPRPTLRGRSSDVLAVADLLGLEHTTVEPGLPVMETQDHDLLIFVDSFTALVEAKPKFAELGEWCRRQRIRGVCLSTMQTLNPSTHVQSRFFAPAVGVNEDPVTGSVHGPLATYLFLHDLVPHAGDMAAITCLQGIPGGRIGLVRALVRQQRGVGFAVRIAGQCRTTMRGRLLI